MARRERLAGVAAIRRLMLIKAAARLQDARAANREAGRELDERRQARQKLDGNSSRVSEKMLLGGRAAALVRCLKYRKSLEIELVAARDSEAGAAKMHADTRARCDCRRVEMCESAARVRLAEQLCRRVIRARRSIVDAKQENKAIETWARTHKQPVIECPESGQADRESRTRLS